MSDGADFDAHNGVVFGVIAAVVILVVAPIGLWCTYDRNDDAIAKHGGPLYAVWRDWNVCLFGFFCPVWQLAEASAEAVQGSCLFNCVVLVWCPLFGHCCVANELASASRRWGGQPFCFHRYICIVCCPCLVSMQATRAVRRRRAINANLDDVGAPTAMKSYAMAAPPPAVVLGAHGFAPPRAAKDLA